jgi:hypothetical protein
VTVKEIERHYTLKKNMLQKSAFKLRCETREHGGIRNYIPKPSLMPGIGNDDDGTQFVWSDR